MGLQRDALAVTQRIAWLTQLMGGRSKGAIPEPIIAVRVIDANYAQAICVVLVLTQPKRIVQIGQRNSRIRCSIVRFCSRLIEASFPVCITVFS